jgi:hypothetical protein
MKNEKAYIVEGIDVSDLPIFNPDWEPSPEMVENAVNDVHQEIENEKNRTIVYDPGEKKRISFKDCKDKYGKEIAEKILKAKKETGGRLNSTDYGEVISKHQLLVNKISETNNFVEKNATNQFVPVNFKILRNSTMRKLLKKSMLLYLYLRSMIVRKSFKGDKLDIYKKFYKKGRLAASISIRKLSKDLYLDEKTVTSYIKTLCRDGIIKFDSISAEESFDNQQHRVYVLGEINNLGDEIFYIDQISENPK